MRLHPTLASRGHCELALSTAVQVFHVDVLLFQLSGGCDLTYCFAQMEIYFEIGVVADFSSDCPNKTFMLQRTEVGHSTVLSSLCFMPILRSVFVEI